MGWQTIAAYATIAIVVIAIVLIAFRMLRREARKTGADSEANKTLEEVLRRDQIGHKLAGGPIPLDRDEQLKRLRALAAKADRRRT